MFDADISRKCYTSNVVAKNPGYIYIYIYNKIENIKGSSIRGICIGILVLTYRSVTFLYL